MILVDFLAFVKKQKENNTYLIHKNIVILFDCCRLCVFVVIANEYF